MSNREDAIKTIRVLCDDLANYPASWENPTLGRYLGAMANWLEDSKATLDEPPSWELICRMLEAAKIYE